MTEYEVQIKGRRAPDDGLTINMGVLGNRAWHEVPLPACPDCGGDLVWYEAGYVPGTRRCMGLPIGGRPTNPLLDRRVPLPNDDSHPSCPTLLSEKVSALLRERNTCSDERVKQIDNAIVEMLYPWCTLSYDRRGGCGSMFSVQTAEHRVYLRRERFYQP
jgi:hypothetical protein